MTEPRHPTFSIIIESENLATEDSAALFSALESLSQQTIPLSDANEAILVNSGRIPGHVEREVRSRYPTLHLHAIAHDSTYYEAKQQPVGLTTGEVVVFCDCDCRYSSKWLESLLAPYTLPETLADVVCGETSIELKGFMSYFIALAWCFPLHGQSPVPRPSKGYAANNVSFRRRLLDRIPIPTNLRLYRGNCTLHARELRAHGITIWKAPGATAFHPVLRPLSVPFRFFMWGHHEASVSIAQHRDRENALGRGIRIAGTLGSATARRLGMPFLRWPGLLRRRPSSIALAPFLLVSILFADVLFVLGAVLTLAIPKMSLLGLASVLESQQQSADV